MARKELVAFGAAVRHFRTKLGISQEALAERSGLHRTYLSGIERGERNVGLVNVYRLAAALRVSTAELFNVADELRSKRRKADVSR